MPILRRVLARIGITSAEPAGSGPAPRAATQPPSDTASEADDAEWELAIARARANLAAAEVAPTAPTAPKPSTWASGSSATRQRPMLPLPAPGSSRPSPTTAPRRTPAATTPPTTRTPSATTPPTSRSPGASVPTGRRPPAGARTFGPTASALAAARRPPAVIPPNVKLPALSSVRPPSPSPMRLAPAPLPSGQRLLEERLRLASGTGAVPRTDPTLTGDVTVSVEPLLTRPSDTAIDPPVASRARAVPPPIPAQRSTGRR